MSSRYEFRRGCRGPCLDRDVLSGTVVGTMTTQPFPVYFVSSGAWILTYVSGTPSCKLAVAQHD